MKVEERLIKVISRVLAIDVSEICLSKSIVSDLGADSIDILEIIMAVEKEFDVEIEDEFFTTKDKGFSVGDLDVLIKGLL